MSSTIKAYIDSQISNVSNSLNSVSNKLSNSQFVNMSGLNGYDVRDFNTSDFGSCVSGCRDTYGAICASFNGNHCWCKSIRGMYPNNGWTTALIG